MVTLVLNFFKFSAYQINDVYNPSKVRGGRLNITTIGKWDTHSGIQISSVQSKIERRRNLGGLKFIAVVTVICTASGCFNRFCTIPRLIFITKSSVAVTPTKQSNIDGASQVQ